MGRTVPAGADILLQMHYGPSPIDEVDQTQINVFYAEGPIDREVETAIMTPQDLDSFFYLPANQVRTFHGTLEVPADLSLLSIAPHCHLIGESWEVFATSPSNQDTIPLISIPQWDFNWQGFFTFPTLTKIPAGYTLHGIASYDNTEGNPFNPSSPPNNVTFGEGTLDEMFFIFFDYVLYEEGDETIALGPDGPEACPEDLTMDGLVSVDDILMMLSDFGCLEDWRRLLNLIQDSHHSRLPPWNLSSGACCFFWPHFVPSAKTCPLTCVKSKPILAKRPSSSLGSFPMLRRQRTKSECSRQPMDWKWTWPWTRPTGRKPLARGGPQRCLSWMPPTLWCTAAASTTGTLLQGKEGPRRASETWMWPFGHALLGTQ
jgi:hypothetical protein